MSWNARLGCPKTLTIPQVLLFIPLVVSDGRKQDKMMFMMFVKMCLTRRNAYNLRILYSLYHNMGNVASSSSYRNDLPSRQDSLVPLELVLRSKMENIPLIAREIYSSVWLWICLCKFYVVLYPQLERNVSCG